ncbi:hypothetical protein KC726_01990 [Candidatus Woesebacteria bacterium]|nr:hypothetical protein [Candidatus Woesebacteria bacterium]
MNNPINILKQSFISELQNGANKKPSSLPFIRHHLSTSSKVQPNETFQTMVIGGSFYQKALMKKVGNNFSLIEHNAGPQPPFLTEQDLMSFLEKHIDTNVKVVALNFAYPLTPVMRNDVLDGVLQDGSKENTFTGLIGKTVGERIEQYMKDKHGQTLTVSSANDTICLLLSGLVTRSWDQLAAGIVGTGLNFAIFLDQHTAVNLESANFDKFEQSYAGNIINKQSAAPGKSLYEKEISGAYLYKHFNILAQKEGLDVEPIRSTKDLDALAKSKDANVASLARSILAVSADMVAAQIAGILEYCGRDLTFIMQGSLYWKGYQFKEIVEKRVVGLVPRYQARYEKVLHSDLFGAAKLVA